MTTARDPSAQLVECSFAQVADAELCAVIAWLCERGRRLDEPGAWWLLQNVFNPEADRRIKTPNEPPRRYFRIPFEIDDDTLAGVLVVLTAASYAEGVAHQLAQLVDGLTVQAAVLCAARLRDGSLRIPPPELN